jgi:hypothetical protein
MSDKKQNKKAASKKGLRNPDRKNGKAWKKSKPEKKLGTMASEIAHFNVLTLRAARRRENLRKAEVGTPRQPKKAKHILASDVTGMKHLEKQIERIVFGSRPAYAH